MVHLIERSHYFQDAGLLHPRKSNTSKSGAVVRALASHQCSRGQILALTPYVSWVCCWFSPLIWEVFLRVVRFSPLLKNQPFQIPIQSGTHGHVSTSSHELLSAPWVKQLQLQWQLQIKRSSVQNPSDSKKFKTYLKDSYCSNYKSWNYLGREFEIWKTIKNTIRHSSRASSQWRSGGRAGKSRRACNYVSEIWIPPPIPLLLPVEWAVRFPPISKK